MAGEQLNPNGPLEPPLGSTVPASRPTPRLEDIILVEVRNARAVNGERPAAYGSAHRNTVLYPNHKLALIAPDGTGTTEKWFYVADRADQDAYNYAITYSGDDKDFPIYTRTYILPRDDYAPLADLAADPDHPGAKLVLQRVLETTGTPELDSLYLKVERVFETLPGPLKTEDIHDNERGEVQRTTQTVIATGAEASSSSVSGGVVTHIDYAAHPDNINLLQKITETWAVPRTLEGQEFDRSLDVAIPYTLTREAAGTSIGVARAEVAPKGDGTDETKTIDVSALEAALEAYFVEFPSIIGVGSLDLPDVLTGVIAFMETSGGDGDSTDLAGYASWSGHGSWTVTPRSSSQSSAAIIPDAEPIIHSIASKKVRIKHHLFFLQSPFDTADVLAKLAAHGVTVLDWPDFNPTRKTIFCVGRRISLQATGQAMRHDGGSDSSSEYSESSGDGLSKEIGLTVKKINVPLTINEAFSYSGTVSAFATATVDAEADAGGGVVGSRYWSEDIYATISPSSCLATDGDTSIPTSGIRLFDVDPEPHTLFGWIKLRATTVDFANV